MFSISVRGASFSQILSRSGQTRIGEQSRNAATLFGGGMGNRHRDPKWKKHRANKVFRVELPDFAKIRDRMNGRLSQEEIRTEYKKFGLRPSRNWDEKPVCIDTLTGIIEPYVPPEGDGKATLLSKSGALQKMEQLKKKSAFMWYLRKLKQFEPDFKITDFATEAQEIYIEAHKALAAVDKDKLHDFVTDGAYPEMISNADLKTLRWKWLGSLEPPRVVHVRTQSFLSEDNMFAQITVRMHTQQTLAVYDRFGRLMHGSEVMVKDVLEYVVFEKQIANLYGRWRLHGKIIPDWQPRKEPSKRTFVERKTEESSETAAETAATVQAEDGVQNQTSTQK